MKKLIFFLVAIFTFSFVNAQEIHLGAKAGLNLASFNTSVDDFNDMLSGRMAFHFGGVIEFAFTDQFSVQPELLYSSVGSTVDPSSANRVSSPDSYDYVIDYISFPVMLKYYVVDGLSLELGPQVSYLLSAKAKNDTDEEDFKDMMKTTDFGLGFGAGYKLENGLFFDTRYVLGLSNTWEDIDNETIKNNVFQFSVGYMFL